MAPSLPIMENMKMTFTDQIRQAVLESGLSRYAIWKATGIDQGALCKFVHGERGLSCESLDKLAEVIGLQVVVRKPLRTRKGKK